MSMQKWYGKNCVKAVEADSHILTKNLSGKDKDDKWKAWIIS